MATESRTDSAQAAVVKARVAPWLNEPYFTVIEHFMKIANQQCTHENQGVVLDKVDRRAYCKGCQLQIDPFDALLYHAASEKRLQSALHELRQREQAAKEKELRDKARRPFLRAVMSRKTVVDKKLKAEPIIGYINTLECQHQQETAGARHYRRLTCRQCAADHARQ